MTRPLLASVHPVSLPVAHQRSVLIVDDDGPLRRVLCRAFERRAWAVHQAADGLQALDVYAREDPDVVLLDLSLPALGGMQVLERLRATDHDATVIVFTGHADLPTAVSVMSAGAENMLSKPVELEHLYAVAERAGEKAQLRRQNRILARRQVQQASFDTLGDSPAMRELARQITLLASGAAPVLLTGETGSGKGWAAKLLHAASERSGGPFVSVNCAGLTATFLDTELFGHEQGAFTDAKSSKQGLFELAHGGTLMLDEVGDLTPELQPKLLTVLETQRFRRLGGTREIQVDVRLVAATHMDLRAAVRAGRFREDLYYRLAVLPVRIPSLRERGLHDVAELAIRLAGDIRRQIGRGPSRISVEALEALTRYSWPGNVRELRNVLERSAVLANGADVLTIDALPADIRAAAWSSSAAPEETPADLTLASVELRHIRRVLELAGGNRRLAARMLGVSRQTLYNRLSAERKERG